MRIGLFGGTFNPVHFGHLRTVLEVTEHFRLDRVYLIPSAMPPHKSSEGIASPHDRLEMVRLATEGVPEFAPSDIELQRTGPSYTIDTLSAFSDMFPEAAPCFLILGLDAFLEIHTWKSHLEILRRVPLIVMGRPAEGGNDASATENGVSCAVFRYLSAFLSPDYTYVPEQSAYRHPEFQPVYLMEVTHLDISSSAIRHRIQNGQSIRFLTPDAVLTYISHKGLYR